LVAPTRGRWGARAPLRLRILVLRIRELIILVRLRGSLDVFVAGGEDDLLGGFDPLAGVVDVGEGADGADDGVGGGSAALGMLDDEGEALADFAGAAGEKAGGVGVAIDGSGGDAEFERDVERAAPVEEALVNGVSLGVGADEAFARVAFGFGLRG